MFLEPLQATKVRMPDFHFYGCGFPCTPWTLYFCLALVTSCSLMPALENPLRLLLFD